VFLLITIQCRLVKHISDYSYTAPVRCFHLTALVLSGEKHLTSARSTKKYRWKLCQSKKQLWQSFHL